MSALSALRLRGICRRRYEIICSSCYRNWTWVRLPFPSNIWIYDCVPLVWSGSTNILKFRRFVCARILRHRRAVCVFCDISRSLDLNEFAATQSDVNVDHAGRLPTTLVVRPAAATAQYLLQFLVLGLITHQCILVCRVAALSKLLDGSSCVWRLIRPLVQGNLWSLWK